MASFLAAAPVTQLTASTFSFPKPAVVPGDVLVLVAGLQADDPILLTEGWLSVIRHQGTTALGFELVATRFIKGGEPATLTLEFDGDLTTGSNLTVLAYRGVRAFIGDFAFVDVVGPTDTFPCPSQTPVAVGDLYIGIAHIVVDALAMTVPGNERYNDAPADGSLAVFDIAAASLSPFGVQTVTASSPGTGGTALSFILRTSDRTQTEQDLLEFALGSLPLWMRAQDEILTAAAQLFAVVQEQVVYLFRQTLITQAEGPTGTTPDWLAQHARDRDTHRQGGEIDAVLQQRLRVFPDALTRQALLDAANALITAAGVSGVAALIELPRDGAWAGSYTQMSGTGGTFTTGPVSFRPTALPWPTPPWIDPSVFPGTRMRLVITTATNAGNNGTREITGIIDNAVTYTNGGAVAGADGAATWKVQHMDALGNVTDGFARSYAGTGWRAARARPFAVLMMLPFGSDQGLLNSVRESLRLKRAAGVAVLVERRVNS